MSSRINRVESVVVYEINGRKYHRLEDVPNEYRSLFADRDGNGVPDVVERAMKDGNAVRRTETRISRDFDASDPVSVLRMTDPELARAVAASEALETIRCASCNYDLQGTAVGGNCPECGQPVTRSIQRMIIPQPSTTRNVFTFMLANPRFVSSLLTLLAVLAILAFIRFIR